MMNGFFASAVFRTMYVELAPGACRTPPTGVVAEWTIYINLFHLQWLLIEVKESLYLQLTSKLPHMEKSSPSD